MAKLLTDKNMLDIVKRAVEESEIDDSDQYSKFLRGLGELICDHFGGETGAIDHDDGDGLGWAMQFYLNENVPEDGGVFKKYHTSVIWKNGEESHTLEEWKRAEENGEVPFVPKSVQNQNNDLHDNWAEEFCPHCGKLSTIKYEFTAQPCSECGEMILPCSICQTNIDGDTDACFICPIEHTKVLNREYLVIKKSLDNALKNAREDRYLEITKDDDQVWDILASHEDIYPFKSCFNTYDSEWFKENKEAFINYIDQVIIREASKFKEAQNGTK